ncbi:hypothetical protein BDW02DRAFT_38265 [Decorospora gaudefroyi]|uniref:Uncharacterized protein n=1 Tax=Decorospora gaudefroyi TaxID=184978 RepID=A0A6A5K3E9_9PLEO|nr:hypothetical protein BDW02DRAFT_38265 [Decorospora gaudefroyi]
MTRQYFSATSCLPSYTAPQFHTSVFFQIRTRTPSTNQIVALAIVTIWGLYCSCSSPPRDYSP